MSNTIKTLDTEVLVIGGGPAGLACAKKLAELGKKTVLVERKPRIGRKVCAGGITWSGLLQNVPEHLIQRSFSTQHIYTPFQHVKIREDNPVIATVDRTQLGKWMAEEAEHAGVRILGGTKAVKISSTEVMVSDVQGKKYPIKYGYLVGADGANSLVRRSLGLKTKKTGIGIHAQLPLQRKNMEWHLCPKYFDCGYGWVFPHKHDISVGCFVKKGKLSSKQLKTNLIEWANTRGIEIPPEAIIGGLVNYDYQGVKFNNTFLIGEAAGLASGLTGEGIYPAIVTGKLVANLISDPLHDASILQAMVKKQRRHHRVLEKADQSAIGRNLMMEILVLLLRLNLVKFNMLEMAD